MTSEFGVAVHALVFLAQQRATASSELLAQNICTNPARVRKVMGKLKKAGLLSTKEGVDGGYRLAVPPGEITLRQVGEAVDAQFVSSRWHSGDTDLPCLVASGMAGVMDTLYGQLDDLCKTHLEGITINSVKAMLLHE